MTEKRSNRIEISTAAYMDTSLKCMTYIARREFALFSLLYFTYSYFSIDVLITNATP